MRTGEKWLVACTGLLVVQMMPACLYAQSIIVNAGARAWVEAARSGRADMLVIGDSVVWSGGNGWDAGLIHSFANRIGLAGTGLTPDSHFTGEGYGYSAYGSWYGGLSQSADAVPEDHRNFVWRGAVTANGTEPSWGFGWGVNPQGILDPTAAYDWHLWTVPHESGAALGAQRRIVHAGTYPIVQSIPAISLGPAIPGELHKIVLGFDAVSSPLNGIHEFQIQNTSNTSIVYSRLLKPGASGATISSWGYGGQSTLRFYDDLWLGSTLDALGRQTLLSSLVDSGSGKLNVVIAEGFNDRNESNPSVHGLTPGNSPEAFNDNITSFMEAIRTDWTAAGHDPGDLSFTLLGMYESGYANEPLREYAEELRQIALSDPQAAFIDLYDVAPRYLESVTKGYILDGVHPTFSGSLAFSDAVVRSMLLGTAAPVEGDINLDGMVDLRDLMLLSNNWQQSGLFLGGDFNGDGVVDKADLGVMARNWQAGVNGELPSLPMSVPEPSWLATFGIAAGVASRRRGR